MIQLVFAKCGNDFGAEKGMPWKQIDKDFENFKNRTHGTKLVMGAKTFKSLPKKLPGRQHFVVADMKRDGLFTKSGDAPDVVIAPHMVHEFLQNFAESKRTYSIIGGTSLLMDGLMYAERVIMTEIVAQYDPSTVTQRLKDNFITRIDKDWGAIESHSYKIDDETNITEFVMEMK